MGVDNWFCFDMESIDKARQKKFNSATRLIGKYFNIETVIKLRDRISDNPMHRFAEPLDVFEPKRLEIMGKSERIEWNELQCLEHLQSGQIRKKRKVKPVRLDDDEKKVENSDDRDDDDNENLDVDVDLVSYHLDCFVIERSKVYELDFYRLNNELFVDMKAMHGEYCKERILDLTDLKSWYGTDKIVLNAREAFADDEEDQSERILLSMETLKIYGGCCTASDRIIKFKDILRPFTNCIVIWNKELVSKLLACGTYNLPTTVI